jgi:hypothetical protein
MGAATVRLWLRGLGRRICSTLIQKWSPLRRTKCFPVSDAVSSEVTQPIVARWREATQSIRSTIEELPTTRQACYAQPVPIDPTTPATKADLQPLQAGLQQVQADVRFLTEQFAILLDRADQTEQKLDDLRDDMGRWKDEIVHEFRVIAEELRHDLIGAHKDKISNHEDRLVRLERHAGLQAA